MPDLFQCRPDRATGHRPPRRLSLGLSAGLALGLSLGLPASCAGCGRWETTLCPQCRELLEGEPFSVEHADAAGDLDVLALATYTGPIRAMVLGWKNGSREDLAEAMARAGRRLGRYWAHTHPPAEVWAGPPGDRPGYRPVSGPGRSTTPAAPVPPTSTPKTPTGGTPPLAHTGANTVALLLLAGAGLGGGALMVARRRKAS